MTIIFLLEEKSMKELLDIILPKLLPADVAFKTIAHSGKSDLQRSIVFLRFRGCFQGIWKKCERLIFKEQIS